MNLARIFNEVYFEIKVRKVPFVLVFFFVVLATYAVLFGIDFIPEPVAAPKTTTEQSKEVEKPTVQAPVAAVKKEIAPVPLKIKFDSLNNKVVTVSNPTSRVVADLDTALLAGAVRHPDSADFAHPGNIFILGHSSYLPTVFNKNFQAFNGIQNLVWGDTIRLYSADTEYIYRVQKVYKAKASDVVVPQTPGKAQLTLATCNSFATKNDRFIVEAALIDSKPL